MPSPATHLDSSERAFPALARADRYFPAASVEAARRRVDACLLRGDGPALVIGASGLGKTMLTEVLTESLKKHLRIVRLSSAQLCTRRALLQAILYELELPYDIREEGALRLSLNRALVSDATHPEGVALLVDEAQALSAPLLEELRGLANIAHRGVPRVRLAMFGGPSLDDLFAMPELEAFSQRIAARCYLSGLTYEETTEYARAHVAAVGGDPALVFTPDGLDALYRASDGVPRLLSQVCDRALMTAVEESCDAVDARVVQLAWSDLHQLPAPWYTPEPQGFPSPLIEDADGQEEEGGTTVVEVGGATDPVDPQPYAAPTWNADQALRSLPSEEEREARAEIDALIDSLPHDPAHESPTAAPAERVQAEAAMLTEDPFGDHFDEEEVVLDRFASLTHMMRPTTPQVSNSVDPSLSSMVSTLQAAADQELERALEEEAHDYEEVCEPTELDELDELDDEPIVNHDPPALRLQSIDDEDDGGLDLAEEDRHDLDAEADILIIEHDTVEISRPNPPAAVRREYRQLFAQLRRG